MESLRGSKRRSHLKAGTAPCDRGQRKCNPKPNRNFGVKHESRLKGHNSTPQRPEGEEQITAKTSDRVRSSLTPQLPYADTFSQPRIAGPRPPERRLDLRQRVKPDVSIRNEKKWEATGRTHNGRKVHEQGSKTKNRQRKIKESSTNKPAAWLPVSRYGLTLHPHVESGLMATRPRGKQDNWKRIAFATANTALRNQQPQAEEHLSGWQRSCGNKPMEDAVHTHAIGAAEATA